MSYNFRTVVGDWSWMEVGQRLDRGWMEAGEKSGEEDWLEVREYAIER